MTLLELIAAFNRLWNKLNQKLTGISRNATEVEQIVTDSEEPLKDANDLPDEISSAGNDTSNTPPIVERKPQQGQTDNQPPGIEIMPKGRQPDSFPKKRKRKRKPINPRPISWDKIENIKEPTLETGPNQEKKTSHLPGITHKKPGEKEKTTASKIDYPLPQLEEGDKLGRHILDDLSSSEVDCIIKEMEELRQKILKKMEEEPPEPKKGIYRGGAGFFSDIKTESQEESLWEEPSIEDKIDALLEIFDLKTEKNKENMVYLICYDITNNKLRTDISDYLLEKGCQRVQKSVFMGELHARQFRLLYETLRQTSGVFDPNDTIMLIPVSENSITAMKLLGNNVDMEFVLSREKVMLF